MQKKQNKTDTVNIGKVRHFILFLFMKTIFNIVLVNNNKSGLKICCFYILREKLLILDIFFHSF